MEFFFPFGVGVVAGLILGLSLRDFLFQHWRWFASVVGLMIVFFAGWIVRGLF